MRFDVPCSEVAVLDHQGGNLPVRVACHVVRHYVVPGFEQARGMAYDGESISEFLERLEWTFKLQTICVVDGSPRLRAEWGMRIVGDMEVYFLSRPYGKEPGSSGGKALQVAGIVGLVALAVFAPYLAGVAGAALGLAAGGWGVLAIQAGIVLAGGFLFSTLIKLGAGGQNAEAAKDQVFSLTAAQNTARLLQMIPIQYGRLKTFPDYVATPWSEYIGENQFLNMLLGLGMGKFQIHQLFIDDTLLWDETTGFNTAFADVQTEFNDPGDPVTLFPSNVVQSVEVSGQTLPNPFAFLGGFIVNAAGTVATDLAFDFAFPQGLAFTNPSNGKVDVFSVTVNAEIRPVNGAGAPTGPYVNVLSKTYTYAVKTPKRVSEKINIAGAGLTPGRYEGRVSRTTNVSTVDSIQDTIIWLGFRAFLEADNTFEDITTIAIRMRASEQLSNQAARRIGVLATRKLFVWDGSGMVEQATRNPMWAFYDAATNDLYGAALLPSKIDFATIVAMATGADTRMDTFDFVFTDPVPVPEAFDTILAVDRAKHRWYGDVLSAVRDELRTPQMLLTDREISRGSLNVEYIFNDEETIDSVTIEYLDEETWGPAEVQYPPNAGPFFSVNTTRKRLPGIVNRDQAKREAAFWYFQSYYRRIRVNLETEHDGRLLNLLAVVRIQSELPRFWGQTAELLGAITTTLTVDRNLDWSASGQKYIGIRTKIGGYFGPVKVTMGGTPNVVLVDATDLTAVETAQSTTLAAVIMRLDGAEPPSIDFGVATSLSRTCVLVGAQPSGDKVSLSFAIDNAAVHDDDLSDVPIIPGGPILKDPRAPIIAGLLVHFRQGIVEPMLDGTWWPAAGAIYYVAQVSYDGGINWIEIYQGSAPSFSKLVEYANLRCRVSAVGVLQGVWVAVDVIAPTIVLKTAVAIESFDAGLRDWVTNFFGGITRSIQEFERKIATFAAAQDAHNFLDVYNIKYPISSLNILVNDVQGQLTGPNGIGARVTQAELAIVNADEAFATFLTTIAVHYATAQNIADASVTIQAAAHADALSAIAAYNITVSATYVTQTTHATALVNTLTSAQTYADHAVTTYDQTLISAFGDRTASVTTSVQAISDITGFMGASYSITLDAGGSISGIKLLAGPGISVFNVNANVFQFTFPGLTTPQTVFQIANVNGVAKGAFRGDMIFDGMITARMITAAEVITLSAQIGDAVIESAHIKTANIDTLHLKDGSITDIKVSPPSPNFSPLPIVGLGVWATLMSDTLVTSAPSGTLVTIRVEASLVVSNDTGNPAAFSTRLTLNGSQIANHSFGLTAHNQFPDTLIGHFQFVADSSSQAFNVTLGIQYAPTVAGFSSTFRTLAIEAIKK